MEPSTPITKFTIFGERCSGTTFLQNAIEANFGLKIVWDYGWKHFYGFDEFTDCDDVLFIGIYRDPVEWMNSFRRSPWHVQRDLLKSNEAFLNNEFYSISDCKPPYTDELMTDRHIHTGERYKNIFESREVKINYLREEMPNKVKHFTLIRYEVLRDNYEAILKKLLDTFNLPTTDKFITPIIYYKDQKHIRWDRSVDAVKRARKGHNPIPKEQIITNPNFNREFERKLGYDY